MKRKISLFLVLVCAFWSCAGALADGFLSPGSSEVTAAFDAAGLKYSQLDISNSGDVFRIGYAPATSTQLDSIVVTIHVMESSAAVLGPSIGDIDTSDMLSLYQALESGCAGAGAAALSGVAGQPRRNAGRGAGEDSGPPTLL